MNVNQQELKEKFLKAFQEQGFKYNPHVRPPENDKETLRLVQQKSKDEQVQIHKTFLKEGFSKIKKHLRSGTEINPEKIKLKLIEVKENSYEEVLFRWWNFMWWSMPYQRGYGRFMRFMLWDTEHNSPFGLIGLQSPVLKLSVRDNYLKLPKDELDIWVNRSMQAQRLGALPPYNSLIGSKMVALASVSNEVRDAYRVKYDNVQTIIKNRKISNDLLFTTTTSAFGRSSIYNRLKYNNELAAIPIGYTQGSGSFHIPEPLYLELLSFLEEQGSNISRGWGNGPSRKLRLIDKGLNLLGLRNCIYHNIKREFYIFPMVSNLHEVIENEATPNFYDRPFDKLFDFWLNRWALPRANRTAEWNTFDANEYIKNIEKKYNLNGKP